MRNMMELFISKLYHVRHLFPQKVSLPDSGKAPNPISTERYRERGTSKSTNNDEYT